nr:serine/threonine protein kinase [Pirellula sp.]
PDGRLFLVMPLVVGRSLSELIHDQGILSPDIAVRIVLELASGLAEVHQHGLLHRDIKPANVVVEQSGAARLTDFGLASFVDEDSSLTESGVVVGTPAYMSPEQACNGSQIDQRSDIYSLGATLYECLTGTRPFRGRAHDILKQIIDREPTRPSLINESIPKPLEAICLKAMSKSPTMRYANMELLITDLQRWQQGKRVSARLPGVTQRTIKWLRKDPRFALSIAVVIATLMAGVSVSRFYWSRSREQSKLAEARFDASLQTINTLADLASQSLSGDPGLASIRKQIQTMADKAFEPLIGQRPSNADALVRYLKAMDNLGTIKHTVSGPAEALAFRQKMIDENQNALVLFRGNNELRRQWARMYHRLAVGHVEMRTFPEATRALDEASKVLSNSDLGDQWMLGSVAHSRGTVHYWVNNDNAKAAVEFRKAAEHFETYIEAIPDDKLARVSLNNTLGWLANCELQLGNVDLAEKMLRQVWVHNAALADAPDGTYLNRLDKHRASLSLLSLLVTRGACEQAVEWSRENGPEIDLLQASNPTLMEPAALKIGFGCDSVAALLLMGKVDEAMSRSKLLLDEAIDLDRRFPKTTRIWQVLGHAKQMWIFSCLQAADYASLVPFLEDWILQIEGEISQQQNVGFNQQMRQLLLCNLVIALEWNGNTSRSQDILLPIINEFPEDLRPAVDLWSRVGPIRRALRDGDSVAWDELRGKVIDPRLEDSISKFGTYMAAGNQYPSTHCVLAECHAAAMLVLMQKPPTKNEPQGLDVQDRIDTHRKAATKLMQSAKSMVFFQQGDRMEKINSDSLFKVTIMLDFP